MEIETEEEDLNVSEAIKGIKKVNPKVWTIIMVVCLFVLLFQLGRIYGFREAYKGQKEYYEEKIERYCFCQETIYDSNDTKLFDIPDLVIEK